MAAAAAARVDSLGLGRPVRDGRERGRVVRFHARDARVDALLRERIGKSDRGAERGRPARPRPRPPRETRCGSLERRTRRGAIAGRSRSARRGSPRAPWRTCAIRGAGWRWVRCTRQSPPHRRTRSKPGQRRRSMTGRRPRDPSPVEASPVRRPRRSWSRRSGRRARCVGANAWLLPGAVYVGRRTLVAGRRWRIW